MSWNGEKGAEGTDGIACATLSLFEAGILRHAVAAGVYESAEFLAREMVRRGLLRDDGPAMPRTVASETAEDVDRRRVKLAKMSPRERAEHDAEQAQLAAQLATAERRRLCPTDEGRAALVEHDAAEAAPAVPGLLAEIEAIVGRIVVTPISPSEQRAREFETRIAPRLRAEGFSAEHIGDLRDWNCEPQRKTFEEVLRVLRTPGAIVALVGIRGSGKTRIAAEVAAEWHREEIALALRPGPQPCRRAMYVKLSDLLGRFKGLFANFGTLDPDKLAGARDYLCTQNELIVIDEVGECEDVAARGPLLTDFLDRIYAAKGRAIVISNQTPEDFERGIGASVMSRLNQYGAIVRCAWPSWRARK